MGREVIGVVVAGMTAEHVLERLRDGVAVITPGDRSDVVLAVASAHAAEGFPSLSCIILNGGFELHRRSPRWWPGCVCGCRSSPPRWVPSRRPARWRRRAGGSPRRRCAKIDTALQLMERHVDITDLLAQLAIPIPTVTTPQMFTYQLRERARADRKHIVLPEGDDDRILKSAGRVLQRGYRGPDHPRRREPDPLPRSRTRCRPGRRGGIRPRTSELCDQFAEQYARVAQEKGCHRRAGSRDHPRLVVFRHHAGVQRHGRRHGVRCGAHHRAHGSAGVRNHQAPRRASRRCPASS